MNAFLIKLIQDIRGSYWFVPSLMVVAAMILSAGTGVIDELFRGEWIEAVPWVSSARTEDMRAVLSTIAGSMMTVAGVTFSITIVAVSFASAQFGPRLIGNFMRDRGNQFTLGTYISTFVYCLMVLGMVEGSQAEAGGGAYALPRVSFMVALLLTLGSIAVLIYFINHVPETINISNITARVGGELCDAMTRLFPSELGEPVREAAAENLPVEEISAGLPTLPLPAGANGYIQAIDEGSLVGIAARTDVVLRLEVRPGDFVTPDKILLTAAPADRIDENCRAALRACFAVGRSRTSTQDTLFLLDELVEIIGRALSPGVCDPFTAINCIDWLESGLTVCIRRAEPKPVRRDRDGIPRIRAHPQTFELLLEAVFDKANQYIAPDRNAALHTMRMIAELGVRTDDETRRALLAAHAARLAAACESALPLAADRDLVRERFATVSGILARAPKDYGRRDGDGWLTPVPG